MQKLAEVCVRRPVFATVLILALVITGLFCYSRIGLDQFPNVDFPIVTVSVEEDGASPQQMETNVIQKLEQSVNTIDGIDTLTSNSYQNFGVITIQFHLDKDINVAEEQVQEAVNQEVPKLPTDIKAPIVNRVDTSSAPIMEIAVSAPDTIRNISTYANQVLIQDIESISGVGQVTLLGDRQRQINIYLDPYKLREYNLTAVDVQNALESQNLESPGGQVNEGDTKITLQVNGRVSSPEQFGQIVIAQRNGAFIRISDVGEVHDGEAEATTEADVDGVPTVLLSIRKQSGQNTVATIAAITDELKTLKAILPPGYKLTTVENQATFIVHDVDTIKQHLIVGSILAALVVLIFLWNWRTTLISGIAIPASIVSTFTLIYALGFTLNTLTLLGLTLAVGIVIDDAIVVLENIYRFIEEKGMLPFEAAIQATREIGLAVLATTLSLVVIFLPVAFMSGIVGRFLNSFGLTMAFAIIVSLLVSFSLTPMLASRWIKPTFTADPRTSREGMPPGMGFDGGGESAQMHVTTHSGSKERGFFRYLDTTYTVALKWCLRHRWVVVLVCIGVILTTPFVIAQVPKNFLPDDDTSQFQVQVRAPEGTSLVSTQALGDRIAAAIRKLPDVSYTVQTIGDNIQQTENISTIFVEMVDVSKRKDNYSQDDVMAMVRNKIMPQFGNLHTNIGPVSAISTGAPQFTVIYSLDGPDINQLALYAQKALVQLKKVPGVVDADTSLILGQPELNVHINRQKAADLGVSVQNIASTLGIMVQGLHVTDYDEAGEQYEVHLRANLPYRDSAQALEQMSVPSSLGGTVLLSQVVTLVPSLGPSLVSRLNQQNNVLIECNVLPGASQAAVSSQLGQIIQGLHMAPGYKLVPFGNSKQLVQAFVDFITAFALALIFMYLVLAAQFESWIHPFTIMTALPLTAPFAFISVWIFGRSLDIFSILGILVLFGVVKKNGILQVDHTNQLRAEGMNRFDAIVQANRDRLRPILMTSIAFIAGLIPLALASGTGAATDKDIGYTVIGGQSLSLILTLLATPVIYSIMDDFAQFITNSKQRVGRMFSRKK